MPWDEFKCRSDDIYNIIEFFLWIRKRNEELTTPVRLHDSFIEPIEFDQYTWSFCTNIELDLMIRLMKEAHEDGVSDCFMMYQTLVTLDDYVESNEDNGYNGHHGRGHGHGRERERERESNDDNEDDEDDEDDEDNEDDASTNNSRASASEPEPLQ
jgi:hypothetical protein